ncbi:contact-dependent growth inhibition system immunity protein [Amycolatopsis sp. NBC_00438]|uniref:contact-dependent growth inhibition system immunity protein n=1 Tax=Amycolatopsis sp. NBC_00438 TaxID=2903558 RepID=UPI002E1FA5AA
MRTVHELRRKPLGTLSTLSTEDLRVLLLQQESVDVLVPAALTLLEEDPARKATSTPATCSPPC